jgi:hypothetical protein
MIVVYLTHGLFLTCTQKITCIYKSYIAIYIQMYNSPLGKITPCANKITLLTMRASFFARGDKFPSTLVSGLPTTAPPLGFQPSQPVTSHSSYYIIYIDNINNLSRLCLGHLPPFEAVSRKIYNAQSETFLT